MVEEIEFMIKTLKIIGAMWLMQVILVIISLPLWILLKLWG